jgi:1-phosphatidylinositol-4-phosphate 5-kinase
MSVTIHESQIMPPYSAADATGPQPYSNFSLPSRTSTDKAPPGRDSGERLANGHGAKMNGKPPNGSAVTQSPSSRRDKRLSHEEGRARRSRGDYRDSESLKRSESSERPSRDDGYFASIYSSETQDDSLGTTHVKLGPVGAGEGTHAGSRSVVVSPSQQAQDGEAPANLHVPTSAHRVSSPPAFNRTIPAPSPSQHPYRLQQRHTLEVPKLATARARDPQTNTDDVVTASGRFSPTADRRRRGSMSLVRRTTRSVNSDVHLDEVPQDDEAARWAEHIRQKRASKRKRREDEDEDRVVVGTKVDQHHVNWVTAYNMLTGIRFTVSRTNAKMDRDLTDADFDAKHKFSFDMYVPPGFPHLVKHLLEFSFLEFARPLPSSRHVANNPPVPATSSLRPQSTTSSSRTTLHGSSGIFAETSSSIPPTTSYR